MTSPRATGTLLSLALRLAAAMLPLLLFACGGGSTMHDPGPGFSLSVPALAVAKSSVGTVTVQINRTGGFQGAVSLAVTSTLPKGIKASFAPVGDTDTTAELSIEAGYPDPSDPKFETSITPDLGSAPLVIQGTSGSVTATTTLNLTVTTGPSGFALGLVDAAALQIIQTTALTLHNTVPLTLTLAPYDSTVRFDWATAMPSTTTFTLGVTGLPKGLTATLPTGTVGLNVLQNVTLTADSTLAAGIYGFSFSAASGGKVEYLPIAVTVAPGAFWASAPAAVTLEQGQTLTLPVTLGHDDVFYVDNGGTDLTYTGATSLAATPSAAGITATFQNSNPTRQATVPLTITAGSTAAPGASTITLSATRSGSPSGAAAATLSTTLNVNVTQASSAATTWFHKVEWGQTILAENLKLVPGKPALLRVHLLADRPSIASPIVTATVQNALGATVDTLTLAGPALVPMAVAEGTLAGTYSATLPAADIAAGMKVVLTAGSLSTAIQPAVETQGFTLDLKLVPIIHKGLTPTLPADADVRQALLASWPIQGVTITHRVPYTTATVVPLPTASTGDVDSAFYGWVELLSELAALKATDNSKASYFGIFNADMGSLATGVSAYVGLHYVGYGAGLGIDTTTATYFGGDGVALTTIVHELGHGFNLHHAPVGGAGGAQENFPYAGAAIGTFGFDPFTGTLYDPATTQDIMGYAKPYWTSDWNYEIARHFVESAGSFAATASPLAADHLVVSGWQGPDGQVHLGPLGRAVCLPVAPGDGPFELALSSAGGTRKVAFKAAEIGCLPKGYRAFTFTVPAGEALTGVEVREKGRLLVRRRPRTGGASQAAEVEERNGALHITWDAKAMPYVSVVHEGAVRTTLALRLQGGSADLPLEGLPKGGRFVVTGSDGCNPKAGRIQGRVERE